jgi:hypothetical protein
MAASQLCAEQVERRPSPSAQPAADERGVICNGDFLHFLFENRGRQDPK